MIRQFIYESVCGAMFFVASYGLFIVFSAL